MSVNSTIVRTPLVISAGDLVVGPIHAPFRDGDPESLLHNYLVLIRDLRGEQREPRLTLRGDDITALAEHLGETETDVLDSLCDLMGATRAQRNALFALFAAGALTILATGSVAVNLTSVGSSDLPPAVDVVDVAPDPVADMPVVDVASEMVVDVVPEPQRAAEVIDEAPASDAMTFADPELAIPDGGDDWSEAVALSQLAAAIEAAEGVADDGSTVAVAPPPVPQPEGQGIADDGSTVAVAPPPMPQPEGQGIADDGSTVAVAPPPVP